MPMLTSRVDAPKPTTIVPTSPKVQNPRTWINRAVRTSGTFVLTRTDFRQCVLYDSPEPDAKIIGIEYMITPNLFKTLSAEERKLWHSHVYEVKSGMLIMPTPRAVPEVAWEKAETAEMKEVITLYGKAYHLWQTDRGDALPLGEPKLMTSYTADGQFDFERLVGDRDRRFGSSAERKRDIRKHIEAPSSHEGELCHFNETKFVKTYCCSRC
jgi:hypothetical protein